MKAPENREGGVILVNVLVIVAIASTIVFMMISTQDISIYRSQRFSDAAQAYAAARGGEASAIVALRRDAIEAPASDHLREKWATIAEDEAPIEGGSFSLAIQDAQDRFNINGVIFDGLLGKTTLGRIALNCGLPLDVADRVARYLASAGPVKGLEELTNAGLSASEIARLSEFSTALPERTDVNMNTAGEALLGILLENKVAANTLVARRKRNGFLTPKDLADSRVIVTSGLGFTSRFYRVRVAVTIGDTTQTLSSLVSRQTDADRVEVVVIDRDRGVAASNATQPPL